METNIKMDEKNLYPDLYEIIKYVDVHSSNGTLDLEEVKKLLNNQISMRYVPRDGIIHYGEIETNKVCYIIKGSYFIYRILKNGRINLLTTNTAPQWSCVDKILDLEHANFVEAKALEECVVLDIDGNYFIESVKKDGNLGIYFIKSLQTLVSTMSTRSDYRIFSDAKECFMFYILEYWNNKVHQEDECTMNLKNDFIASEIGISTRTLYRIQNDLKNEKLIKVKKGKITVNSAQIKKMSEYFT